MVKGLAELKEDDIAVANNSMYDCIGFLDHLDALLKVYIKAETEEERASLNFAFPVEKIENEIGYLVFLQMMGAVYNPKDPPLKEELKNKPKGFVPFRYLLPCVNFNTKPTLPWDSFSLPKLIYKEEVENMYKTFDIKSKEAKTTIDDYLTRVNFASEFEANISSMAKYPRSKELLEIYKHYLLAKDLGYEVNFLAPLEQKALPPKDSKSFEILLRNYVHDHFDIIKQKNISITPKFVESSNILWEALKSSADQLLTKIVYLELNNELALKTIRGDLKNEKDQGKTFSQISNTESILDILCRDLEVFFVENNINFKDSEGIRFPKVKEIKKLVGGPKMISRITEGDKQSIKGFAKIGEYFKEYLIKQENPDLALPVKSTRDDQLTTDEVYEILSSKEQ